jgi:glycosyltransferase involved in cell wall biosynthesis
MPYLKETAQSVFKLDFNYEWIIYDNYSTDGTKRYLRQIDRTSNKTRVFFNSKNLERPYPNFTKGLAEAKGQYLMFLDSDDVIASGRTLKACIEVLESNRDVYVAISEVAYMDEKGKIYKQKKIPFVNSRNFVSGKILFWIILLWPTYPVKFGAVMIREDLFKKTGAVYDIHLVLKASKYTSFAIIKEVGLNYRNISESLSSKRHFRWKYFFWIKLIDKLLPTKKYFYVKYFIMIYKIFLQLAKILYSQFTYKRY